MPLMIDRSLLKREARARLRDAQVPPRRFFALYLGILTAAELVAVAVQLLGGDKALLEDLPSLFAVVLVNLAAQLLLVGTLLYALGIWRGQRMEYGCLFDGFAFAGRCVVVAILQYALLAAGMTLMILPGLYFFYVYRFALFELCEAPEIGPLEAMRRSRLRTFGCKRQLFVMDLSFLPWIILARLPELYQDLVYTFQATSALYGLSLPAPPALPLSALAETLLSQAVYFIVALVYLPHYTTCLAALYDAAKEVNPVSAPPSAE